jgi:hypothetical protein
MTSRPGEGGRKMSKLAAAIRNHFVVFPHIEGKTPSSRSPRQIPATIRQGAAIPWRSPGVVIPRLSAALRTRLSPFDIEAMSALVPKANSPASTPPLLPDSSWASLAYHAPAVCSQLRRIVASEYKAVRSGGNSAVSGVKGWKRSARRVSEQSKRRSSRAGCDRR